ncbi:MAG: HAD-IA family hydrolase [bacterium]
MIKHIIFDLGNVLLDQKTITADVYFASILRVPVVDSAAFYAQYNRDVVSGVLSFVDLVKLYKINFKSNLQENEIVKQYKQLYINDVKNVNGDLINLLKQLHGRYSIYMMTNTLEPHFDHWNTFGFDMYFDRIFRSDTDHFIKPEKQAYEYVLEEIGAKAEECVFIDDLPANVLGAAQIGIKGIVYTNFLSLVSDLAKLGIPIS